MIVDCAHYRDGHRLQDGSMKLEDAASAAAGGGQGEFIWLGLHEPKPDLLEEVGRRFNLHELAIEDADRAHQRPKLEDYEDSWFAVLKSAHYDEQAEIVNFGEIHVFIGPGYVITVRHGPEPELAEARRRAEGRPELLAMGPAAAMWAILDQVVDDYSPVVAGIDDDIEEVEEDVFHAGRPAPTQRIYSLKREVIEFHRSVSPLLAPLEALERGAHAGIPDELRRYFRDVADHARRISDQVNSQRELLTSVLEANLALVSVEQNEVVKKISSVAAILAVPTFIASIYGMNFTNMPELNWGFGYPLTLGLMVFCVIALSTFFRRIDWL